MKYIFFIGLVISWLFGYEASLVFYAISVIAYVIISLSAEEEKINNGSSHDYTWESSRPQNLTDDSEKNYSTLGVESWATDEEVKRAYRMMAKRYHPDVCSEPNAASMFRMVDEAYKAIMKERGCM